MTQKTLSAIIFTMIILLTFYAALTGGNTVKSAPRSKETRMMVVSDHQETGKKTPVFPEPHPNPPFGKAHVPQMEELPHLHKFHKERVKKIKRHGRYWVISQIIVILCQLSILVIGYLHATH